MSGKTVDEIKNSGQDIELEQLNQLESELIPGNFVFISLGGDRVSWNKGLIGLASIIRAPYDKGYDPKQPRNFKLGIKMELVLSSVMERKEFISYADAYDAAGIGPNTKGEQNQAIKSLTDKQAVSILRAMADRRPDFEQKIKNIFEPDFYQKIFGKLPILVLNNLSYGESRPADLSDGNINGETELRKSGGKNILLYGVPGCGKSHYIMEKYCSDDKYMERVVFHPDYTYSDFTGQIMPGVNKETKTIEYSFSEGPLTRILRESVSDPFHMYYLIIEEINRGNAPAVFGDVFQLLDREKDGESSYGITNYEIADAVYGDKNKKVKLPGNLTIIATMNTADQSVFVLDTAFKRRWKMKLIPNSIEECRFADTKILDTELTWKEFATAVNKIIICENSDMIGSEDKRLGTYFVNEEDLMLIDGQYNPAFAEKILMYLWNDVFKYNKDVIFDSQYLSLEELIDGFKLHKFNVFKIFASKSEGEDAV